MIYYDRQKIAFVNNFVDSAKKSFFPEYISPLSLNLFEVNCTYYCSPKRFLTFFTVRSRCFEDESQHRRNHSKTVKVSLHAGELMRQFLVDFFAFSHPPLFTTPQCKTAAGDPVSPTSRRQQPHPVQPLDIVVHAVAAITANRSLDLNVGATKAALIEILRFLIEENFPLRKGRGPGFTSEEILTVKEMAAKQLLPLLS